MNYLNATSIEDGQFINFGRQKVELKLEFPQESGHGPDRSLC